MTRYAPFIAAALLFASAAEAGPRGAEHEHLAFAEAPPPAASAPVLATPSRWSTAGPLLGAAAALAILGALLRAERRARRDAERLRSAALSSLPGYVVLLDRRGVILDVNRASRTLESSHPLSGLDPGDNWLDRRPFGAALTEQVREVVHGRRRSLRAELLVGAPSSQSLELRARRLARPEGGAILSFTDIGKRRRAELAARRAEAALAHLERVAALGELTSALTHELAQPLAAIHTNAHVARKLLQRSPAGVGEAEAAVADVLQDSERAVAVLHRLRALIKRGEVRAEPVDLRIVARDAAAVAAREAALRGIALARGPDGPALSVLADPVHLQQIALNLLRNAFDAVAPCPEERRRVEISVREVAPGRAELSVRDSGAGLDPEVRERLFEPFFTTKEAGLGLGLSLCRSLAEAHGGAVSAAANPEGGATFSLRLPLHR